MTDHRAERAAEYRRAEAAAKTPDEIEALGRRRSRLIALGEWPIEAAAIAPPPAASIPTPAAPAPKPAPTITGTREDRLRRIAVAFGTDERTLEAAIEDGLSPDGFAMIASEESLVKAKAREILEG